MYKSVCTILVITITVASCQDTYLFKTGKILGVALKGGTRVKFRYHLEELRQIDHHLFSNASELKVVSRNLPLLFRNSVTSLPKLEHLRLPRCSIREISPGAFQNLPLLTTLHLQDNELPQIEEGVFNYLTVEELYLHRNKIKTIRTGAFDNMPNLEMVKLNSNHLNQWDSGWFRNCPRLVQLFFRRNKITELPANAFGNLKSSHEVKGETIVDLEIYLSHNRIAEIHPEAFKNLDAMYRLYLDRNRIAKIDVNTFAHMTQLDNLSLRKNELQEIDVLSFKYLEEMSLLDLARNRFECLSFEIVSLADEIKVDGNIFMNCDCLYNLKRKLSEAQASNRIDDNDECVYEE